MTESTGDFIPLVVRIMEEFSKPLSSLLKELYAQSLGSPESRITDRSGRSRRNFEFQPAGLL